MPEEEKVFKFLIGILGRSTGKFMMFPSLFGGGGGEMGERIYHLYFYGSIESEIWSTLIQNITLNNLLHFSLWSFFSR